MSAVGSVRLVVDRPIGLMTQWVTTASKNVNHQLDTIVVEVAIERRHENAFVDLFQNNRWEKKVEIWLHVFSY